MPEQNWLKMVKKPKNVSRGFESPSGDMQGVAKKRNDRLFLELSKARETVPRQQEETTHDIDDMATKGDEWHPIEEAFALFFTWNTFALVRTSNSAPSATAVTSWLNTHAKRPFGFWSAAPIVDRDKYQRLQEMGGLTLLRVVSAPISSDEGDGSWWREMLNLSAGPPADLALTIELKTTRGRNNRSEQEQILAQAKTVLEHIRAGDAPEITAAEVRGIPEAGGRIEPFSLIEENVGVSQPVPLSLVGGAFTLRPEHTVEAMQTAFVEVEASIRASLGVSPEA
ncbi:hypothetical protein [Tsukamurella tyrosinosolvens]|uniref:hypothetical protein n=1 Tax=Tsukamurella tyrosinosolvens TaxID=57704 RepID=UPI00125F2017|nr:hypothetical protein [Tsukamurella tyrosinosolvens]